MPNLIYMLLLLFLLLLLFRGNPLKVKTHVPLPLRALTLVSNGTTKVSEGDVQAGSQRDN